MFLNLTPKLKVMGTPNMVTVGVHQNFSKKLVLS